MGPMQAAIHGMESAAKNYSQDLDAMSDDQILTSAGGTARKPVDFTYEVALINRRLAARLAKTEPPAAPEGDDWWVAPEELQTKDAISQYFKASCEELLEAAKGMSEEDATVLVTFHGGEKPSHTMVTFAAMHTMYHDAQLNFIQSLAGDSSVHWG